MAAAGAAASARRAARRPDRDLGGQQDRPRRGLGRNDRGSAGRSRHRRPPGLVRLHGVGVLPSRNDAGAGAAKEGQRRGRLDLCRPLRLRRHAVRRVGRHAEGQGRAPAAAGRVQSQGAGAAPRRRVEEDPGARGRDRRGERPNGCAGSSGRAGGGGSRQRSGCPRASSPEREVVSAELGVPVEVLRSILANLVGTAAA